MNIRQSLLLVLVCLLVLACSGEPSKPANLPYAAAKENLSRLDYDAALKLDPGNWRPLYGRGVVKL